LNLGALNHLISQVTDLNLKNVYPMECRDKKSPFMWNNPRNFTKFSFLMIWLLRNYKYYHIMYRRTSIVTCLNFSFVFQTCKSAELLYFWRCFEGL